MLISPNHRRFLAVVTLLSASNAMSQDISFDYVQVTYTFATVDLGASVDEIEGNGIGLSLSLSFNPAFALTLSVLDTTFEAFQGLNADTSKATTLGVTSHIPTASGSELFANLSALKAEITVTDDSGATGDNDYGYTASIGVRHFVTDTVELEFGVSHAYVFDHADNSFKADARLYIRKRLSLGIGYIAGDNVDSFSLNLRLDV
ncbi:MAG: outer membrane beta-barrel protein [Gammaproteobacteria bacterium]|nr:outer membrane beta-barrel protein [Gammaproteobacteria bacterium]